MALTAVLCLVNLGYALASASNTSQAIPNANPTLAVAHQPLSYIHPHDQAHLKILFILPQHPDRIATKLCKQAYKKLKITHYKIPDLVYPWCG